MTVNTFFNTWKWPNGIEDTETSVFDIPAGVTNIDVPSALTNNFRDFGFEVFFTGVTSGDDTLVVDFFRANTISAFNAPNIERLGTSITLDNSVTSNSSLVFLRDIKNLDNEYLRLVITAPAGVTANVVINVKVGTNAR